MKLLRVIGLGLAIWGLSLLWPEINQLLPTRVMAGLGLGLGIITLVYDLWRHFSQHHKHRGRPHSDHPTQSIPPVALAR